MGESPDFRPSGQRRQREWIDAADWVDKSEPKLTKKEQQDLAHGRGRICKERACHVCAPLRKERSLKKKQRKDEAQAAQHAAGKPCSRRSCELTVCVAARNASDATGHDGSASAPVSAATETPEQAAKREAKRHRVGLPCGSESCAQQTCIDGFANECTRRHRARRPCRSSTCDNPICVASH